jgi:hypothetical protein
LIDPNDLAATWGDQLQVALSDVVGSFTHQEAYEIWSSLDVDLTIAKMSALASADLAVMADAARSILECSKVTPDMIEAAIRATIKNWE